MGRNIQIPPLKILSEACELVLSENASAISHLVECMPHSDVTIKSHIVRDTQMLFSYGVLKYHGNPVDFLFKSPHMVKMAIADYSKREGINKEMFVNFGLKSIEPITEDTCIAFLKERGYKIMRSVVQFEEV